MTTAPLISQLSARPSWLYPVHCETGRHRSAGALPLAGPAAPAALVGIQLTLVRLAAALISISSGWATVAWKAAGALLAGVMILCVRTITRNLARQPKPARSPAADSAPNPRFCAPPGRRFCARPSRRFCAHPALDFAPASATDSAPSSALDTAPTLAAESAPTQPSISRPPQPPNLRPPQPLNLRSPQPRIRAGPRRGICAVTRPAQPVPGPFNLPRPDAVRVFRFSKPVVRAAFSLGP